MQRASHQTFKDIPMNGTINDCIENEVLSKWSRKMLTDGGEERRTVLFRPLYNNETIISGVFTLRYGLFLANSFPLDMIKVFLYPYLFFFILFFFFIFSSFYFISPFILLHSSLFSFFLHAYMHVCTLFNITLIFHFL